MVSFLVGGLLAILQFLWLIGLHKTAVFARLCPQGVTSNSPRRRQASASRPNRLRVIVSCTDRKHIDPPDRLRMRSVHWRGTGPTARLWMHRLERTPAPVDSADT